MVKSNFDENYENNKLNDQISELENFETKYIRAQAEIQHRLELENALAETSKLFMGSDSPDIQHILSLLGTAVTVNRVYLFKLQDDGKTLENSYEWCDLYTDPKIGYLQAIDSSQFAWWTDQLSVRQAIIVSKISDLPAEAKNEKLFMVQNNIQSLVFVPIVYSNGNLCGYIGFDDCQGPRLWREEDIRLLTVAADLFAYYAERARSLKALQNREANLLRIADKIPAYIYISNGNDQPTIYHNAGYESIIGGLENYASAWECVHPDSREIMQKRGLARMRNEDVPDRYEIKFLGKDGQTYWGDLSANLIKYQGKMAILGIIYDITERKLVEEELRRTRDELELRVSDRTFELKQANDKLQSEIIEREKMQEQLLKTSKLESLGILAGGIAHDFNNILTVISGNISLSKMLFDLDDGLSELLIEIEKAALQARDLTQQLLTFSKGGIPFKETASIRTLLLETSRFVLRGSNVCCQDFLPPDLWPVSIDKGQISQVINNLIINADQAMPEGGFIRLSASNLKIDSHSLPGLDPGKYVKISIKDEGIGIPPKHLDKIFDPYFTTKQKGHGLGLATVYSIIKKHNGDIQVASEFGIGTTFDIYLPASEEELLENHKPHESIIMGQGRILIMDDDETLRKTLSRILKRLGYECIGSADGHQAIDIYQQALEAGQAFDMVIIDLTIPGSMGGKETINKLKVIDSEVKAIVSSGYSNDPLMINYHDYGFDGFLAKPFVVEDIYQVVNKVLSGRDQPTPDSKIDID